MKTKYNLLIFIAISILSGCSISEDYYVDTTIMPEETRHGAGTFGCLIDGWVYTGGRYYYKYNDSIYFFYDEENDIMEVNAVVNHKKNFSFIIQSPLVNSGDCRITNVSFYGEEMEDMKATITHHDEKRQIISGRFSGGRITEGRFDVVYSTREDENNKAWW